jgi:16S rRNA (cytidine1402-2'-O)-methyltransferase
MPGTLYLVATPIGNLKDISQRALETLQGVDLIACEDTRHTAKLLNAYGIKKKLVSYHEHNEASRAGELSKRLANGESVALVSDAGTPSISDPGFRLVEEARKSSVQVVSIPGPVAFVNAALVSGLPTNALFFGGFLPSRKGDRRRAIQAAATIPATLVFYESPHRLDKSLADCADILGPRNAAVVRELTKLHEEVVTGELPDLAKRYSSAKPKGEFVLVIAGDGGGAAEVREGSNLAQRVKELELSGEDRKAAMKQAAREFGMTRSEAYRQLQSEPKKGKNS